MLIKRKGKKVKLTTDMITAELLLKLEKKFKTDLAISKAIGTSEKNIGRIRAKVGLGKEVGRPVNGETVSKILSLAEKGISALEITEKLGIHKSFVYRYFPKKHLIEQNKVRKEARLQSIRDAFEEGLTFDEMRERFQFATSTMRNQLSMLGLSIRDRDAV